MYHSVPFYRSGSNGNLRYKYLENRTVYFVEHYIIVKLQYCVISCTLFFFQMIKYHFNSEYLTFKLVVKLLLALYVYMVFDLQVFLVISKINMACLNPLYRKTLVHGRTDLLRRFLRVPTI